jgi:hypothetical protein
MQLGAQKLLFLINKLQIAKSVPEGILAKRLPNKRSILLVRQLPDTP